MNRDVFFLASAIVIAKVSFVSVSTAAEGCSQIQSRKDVLKDGHFQN